MMQKELSDNRLHIFFMDVFILISFGKILKIFGLHFPVNMLNFPCRIGNLDEVSDLLN